MARALGAMPPPDDPGGGTRGEREPLLGSPDPGGGLGGGLPNFGTAEPKGATTGQDTTLIPEGIEWKEGQRVRLGAEEYHRRRNEWSSALALDEFVPPLSLRQRLDNYRKSPDKQETDRSGQGCFHQLKARYFAPGQDWNPVLRETLKSIKITFGSGVAAYFYDWRWLIMLNLAVFLMWFIFVIMVWLIAPPKFSDSNPPNAYFWDRNDLNWGMFFGGTDTKKTHALQDSFIFYTGYQPKMGTTSEYQMGPVWVACTIGTCVMLFSAINHRLIAALKKRVFDPDVLDMVRDQDKEADIVGADLGQESGKAILGLFDHSCFTLEGQRGTMKALVTKLESMVANKYKACGYPVDLSMGKEVFQVRCRLGMLEQFKAGTALVEDCVFDMNVVYRRKLAPGVAAEVADNATLKRCLDEYIAENPEAKPFAVKGPEDSNGAMNAANAAMSMMTGNKTAQAATGCILKFGDYWTTKHALKQVQRMSAGEWKPSHSWLDGAERHKNKQRPGCVFTLQHGEQVSSVNRFKQAVGIFLTLLFFAATAFMVYLVTHYGDKITELWAYGNTVLLVLIQTVVPVVVKLIVKFESWSSDELAMRWTLGRVYVLKMANLVVLLYQLDNLAKSKDSCASLEVGLYIYNLVITTAIMNIFINFFSYWGIYRFTGRTRVEFDHQTVAQSYIDLNYTIALVWIGTVVSPLLPLVYCMLAYVEFKWMGLLLKWFCKTSENPYQATPSTKMLTMMIFLGTFAFTCWPNCLFLYNHPSILYTISHSVKYKAICGPIMSENHRYDVLVDFLVGWAPALKDGLLYFSNPVVLLAAVAILAVMVAYNYEATDMVRGECAQSYLDAHNSTKHLRQRRIQANILSREKGLLESQVADLNQQVADLEAGQQQLRETLKAEQEKSKKSSIFGSSKGATRNPEDVGKKGGGCFG